MSVATLAEAREFIRSHAKAARDDVHLSQAQVAKILGVSEAAIGHWETGKRQPRGQRAIAYAKILTALTAAKVAGTPIVGPTIAEVDERSDHFERLVGARLAEIITEVVDQLPYPPTEQDLMPVQVKWNQVVHDELIDEVEAAYRDAAAKIRQQVSDWIDTERGAVTAAFVPDPTEALMQQYLQEAEMRIRRVSPIALERIREQLVLGMKEGESIPQIRDRIGQVNDFDYSPSRGTTIARTEIVGASNAGTLTQMEQTGLPYYKTWIATDDDRTRDDHLMIGGETVAKGEFFQVGGFPMQRPGDPNGPAHEVINCRCTLSFVIPDDAEVGHIGDLPWENPALRRPQVRTVGELIDTHRAQAMTDMVEGLIDDLPIMDKLHLDARVTSRWMPTLDGMRSTIRLFDEEGTKIASFVRDFYRRPDGQLVVNNAYFKVEPWLQGQGIATEITKALETWYRASGVTRVYLDADMDVGGYAWARAGFDWDWEIQGDEIAAYQQMNQISNLIGNAAASDENQEALAELDALWKGVVKDDPETWPTPAEFSRVGYTEGAEMWPGKEGMLDSAWSGIKRLDEPIGLEPPPPGQQVLF